MYLLSQLGSSSEMNNFQFNCCSHISWKLHNWSFGKYQAYLIETEKVLNYYLMHRSVTFYFHFVLSIKPSDITFAPCLTANAKQCTQCLLLRYLAESTSCLTYFSLLFGKGAYPMKHKLKKTNRLSQ